MNVQIALSAIYLCFEQQIAQSSCRLVLFFELSSSSEGELICIMLTMESTIMDMAMGVDETDCRNVVFLFGFSLDGGRRIGMSGTNFCFVPVDWVVLTG